MWTHRVGRTESEAPRPAAPRPAALEAGALRAFHWQATIRGTFFASARGEAEWMLLPSMVMVL